MIPPSHRMRSGMCVVTSEVGSDPVLALHDDSKSPVPLQVLLWPLRSGPWVETPPDDTRPCLP